MDGRRRGPRVPSPILAGEVRAPGFSEIRRDVLRPDVADKVYTRDSFWRDKGRAVFVGLGLTY